VTLVPTATVGALEVTTVAVGAFVVAWIVDVDWLGSSVDVPEKIARIVLVPTVRNVVVVQLAAPATTAMPAHPTMGAPFETKSTVPAEPAGLTPAVTTTDAPLVCGLGEDKTVVVVVVDAVSGVIVTVPVPKWPVPRKEPERFAGE
jgi:hypothetical protein